MMSIISKLLLLLLLEPLAVLGSMHHLASRQSFECGAAPVDCGNGWCCMFGETCQAAPDDGFVCIDSILTNSDGLPNTNPAHNPSSLDSVISAIFTSATQPWTITLPETTQTISFPPLSTSAIANSSTSSSSSDRSTITPAPSASARTSTIIPTTTSDSFGEPSVKIMKGWWIGVVLGIAWMFVM
ncbi:hypothetical protein DL98DRAFT_594942 [Cadophora sp. DSE1049]|nr:hypothetical protein DL98DRAFT_594942 [Cadophora sp. DSE1049]